MFRESCSIDDVLKAERNILGIERGKPTTGLAISGGGIRSASFGLGVLQAFLTQEKLSKVDYLSTVSGGGYIGSALTWFLTHHGGSGDNNNDSEQFEPHRAGKGERRNFVNYLQQHGNYLTPSRWLNLTSVLAVLFRSLLLSFLIYFSILLVAVAAVGLFARVPLVDTAYEFVEEVLAQPLRIIIPVKSDSQPHITPGWRERAFFRFFAVLAASAAGAFVLAAVIFFLSTIITWVFDGLSKDKYCARNLFQIIEGVVLKVFVACFVLMTVPMAHYYIDDGIGVLGVVGYVSGAWAALAKLRSFLGNKDIFKEKWMGNLLFRLGAIFFVYAAIFYAYHWSLRLGVPLFSNSEVIDGTYPRLGGLLSVALFFGWLLNINDATVGSMYRDRLMETFLPNNDKLPHYRWKPAEDANLALLEDMCKGPGGKIQKPYHLINTNVILVGSDKNIDRQRGGDSFLLSPLYCGSDATEYIKTSEFIKDTRKDKGGLTLATAMASSGAAVNPHCGPGGRGATRDRLVSLIMTVFNLRLGFWATNPKEKKQRRRPNYLIPGLCSMLGICNHKQDNTYVELSDGGHFENLGLYELVRRRVDTIIVSDAGADKGFGFGDLANAIERVRADFGVDIRFRQEKNQLGDLLPGSSSNGEFTAKLKLAKKGYACGTIVYPEIKTGEYPKIYASVPKKKGNIILIKSALLPDLPADLYGYKARNKDFPDQTTGDQFFDENQFEAYRELGFHAAKEAVQKAFPHTEWEGVGPPYEDFDLQDLYEIMRTIHSYAYETG